MQTTQYLRTAAADKPTDWKLSDHQGSQLIPVDLCAAAADAAGVGQPVSKQPIYCELAEQTIARDGLLFDQLLNQLHMPRERSRV